MPRAVTALLDPSDADREELAKRLAAVTPERLALGKQRFLLASALQFTLPGCPCVYYGDEAGMTGYRDPFNRQYYPWGREDRALQEQIRTLAALRRTHSALRLGTVEVLEAGNGCFVFRRTLGEERIVVACGKIAAEKSVGEVLYTNPDSMVRVLLEK